ncbi:hypothetical protein D9M68_891940 [compost metagenome]
MHQFTQSRMLIHIQHLAAYRFSQQMSKCLLRLQDQCRCMLIFNRIESGQAFNQVDQVYYRKLQQRIGIFIEELLNSGI